MYKEPKQNSNTNENQLKREMKFTQNEHTKTKNYKEIDEFLKSMTKNFMKEETNIESLDKAYYEMVDKNKNEYLNQRKEKKKEEKAIFYDIFIKPKETKIEEIRNKRLIEKKLKEEMNKKKLDNNNETYTLKSSNNKKVKSFFTSKMKGFLDKIKNSEKTKSSNNLFLISGTGSSTDLTHVYKNKPSNAILNYLSYKYLPHHLGTNKANFFNQLIQIKPPEGINAIVASPLIESKGWAPSIPSMQITKSKTTLSDLMLRAKGGIQPGDIPKEAHMAFYLGVMNEEEKNYEEALKFYKKYFLSAKLLQDIYGTELALNRIAVLYSNLYDYEQSLYYNEKHKEITTHNINGFVSYFNSGICLRMIGDIKESLVNFQKALQFSNEESDLEAYILTLSQMSISLLFNGNIEKYNEFSNEFFEKNKILKHPEMEMEMLMLSGFVFNYLKDYEKAYDFYSKGLVFASKIKNEYYKAVCLSNLGTINFFNSIDEEFKEIEEKQEKYYKYGYDESNRFDYKENINKTCRYSEGCSVDENELNEVENEVENEGDDEEEEEGNVINELTENFEEGENENFNENEDENEDN